jgi:Spy/CpxP family protein refolding chaperone
MGHAMEIGLDDAQKTTIKNEVMKVQGRFTDLQFELQGESEKMIRLLQEKPVDETKVLAEVDRILAIEKEVKKMQVALLVRIKNVLSPQQQAKLTEIQKAGAK